MILRWEQGRAVVDRLLYEGKLTRVAANRDLADDYIRQATQHLGSAENLRTSDPEGAFQLCYDAARKALAAILVNQGLRASGAGSHLTIEDAVKAQLGGSQKEIIDQFAWLRRLRNTTEYPDAGEKPADAEDVSDGLPAARSLVDLAKTLLDNMPAY